MDKVEDFKLRGFLERHGVSERLRAKMLDWMVEVLTIYSQGTKTIFRAVWLLDLFLAKSSRRVEAGQVHLLGLACLMIASKQEEVAIIKTKTFSKEIAYGKYSESQLRVAEVEILLAIDFRVQFPTLYELGRCAFRYVSFAERRLQKFFEESCLLILQMSLFSKDILENYSYNELVGMSMILILKILESMSSRNPIRKYIKLVVKLLRLEKKTLKTKLSILKNYALDFDQVFPYVKNL